MVAKYTSNPRQEHGQVSTLSQILQRASFALQVWTFLENVIRTLLSLLGTSKSRSGWLILYANSQVIWCSKLDSQVALPMTEAEYIALSQALCDVIPIIALLAEMRGYCFQVICEASCIYCKAFEDNSGALGWPGIPNSGCLQNVPMYVIIIFGNMFEQGSSKTISSNPKIKSLT
ncbi:hypothetical protein ACHAW6_001978 [Cyclotella cf. meneghiniana]